MSKLLKEWNRLAFSAGTKSVLNESIPNSVSEYTGQEYPIRFDPNNMPPDLVGVGIYNLSPDDGWNTYQNFTKAFERAVDPSVNPYVLASREKGFRQENEGYPWYYMCPYSEEINGEVVFVGCSTPEECEDGYKDSALDI